MNAAYLTHHYILLRFNQAKTEEDKIKLALSYFENVAEHVDKELLEAIQRETTIIVATSGDGEITAYRA